MKTLELVEQWNDTILLVHSNHVIPGEEQQKEIGRRKE
jgi:hypothetical protein